MTDGYVVLALSKRNTNAAEIILFLHRLVSVRVLVSLGGSLLLIYYSRC